MKTLAINRVARNVHKSRYQGSRNGFTLLELVIVMLILVALSATLLPVFTDMTTRTHGSAGASNIAGIAKAVQTHEVLYNSSPNFFDSLIDETGSLGASPGAVVVSDATYLVATDLASGTVGNELRIAEALNRIGINTTQQHLSTSTNKTFEPYNGTNIFTIMADANGDGTANDPSGQIVVLTAVAELQIGVQPSIATATQGVVAYVALGLGARSNMIGRSIVESPVHYPESGESPIFDYNRFLVIYAIPAEGPARFATIAAGHEEGLAGLNQHLKEYYETQQ